MSDRKINTGKQTPGEKHRPVREGQDNSSILGNNEERRDDFPKPTPPDKQVKNQPEFIDKQGNRKDDKT